MADDGDAMRGMIMKQKFNKENIMIIS